MISTDNTTEASYTQAAEDRENRDNRERHTAIIDGLQELADYLADAGPAAGLLDWQSAGRIGLCIGRQEAPVETRLARLTAIADTLGVEVQSSGSANGATHYHATRSFGPIEYDAFTIVDAVEAEDTGTALAEAVAATETTDGGVR
jgi:hypothetical protein